MNDQIRFAIERVDFIPNTLFPNTLYISSKYNTAIHLCACGCGRETVTPLRHDGWQLTEEGGAVTLAPSIGNFNFPCRSHYWIRKSSVVWA